MTLIKTYLIVTNNALELPVMVDIRGVKEAADYLGITVQAARNRIHKNSWGKLPYKILVDELAEPIAVDRKAYEKRYRLNRDRSQYMREYYRKNRERVLAVAKAYRERRKEKINEDDKRTAAKTDLADV